MDRNVTGLIAGALLFAGATLVLLASLLPGIDLPVAGFFAIGIALLGGVYLLGISRPGRPV